MNLFRKIVNAFKLNNDNASLGKMHDVKKNPELQETSFEKVKDAERVTRSKKPAMTKKEINDLIDRIVWINFKIDELKTIEIDPLFWDAASLVVHNQIASPSLIQRRLKLGYNRADKLMEQLEIGGIVGPYVGQNLREVIIKTGNELEFYSLKGHIPINLQSFYNKYKDIIERKKIEFQQKLKEEQLKNEKDQIKRELLEKERKKQLQKQALEELIAEGSILNQFTDKEGKRALIPQEIMDSVWNRDGGKCVKCGSNENLEFDHIIPFSKGGANTYRNLQILCKKCNCEKSNKIG